MDKAGGDKRYDPLGPLYQLLEKGNLGDFVDEGLEVATNCSHIVWVGTANQLHMIAEPILSRFTVLEVQRPTAAQMEQVLRSIYQKIRRNQAWGEQFTEQLSASVIDKMIESELEPRLMQKALIAAAGKAVLRQAGNSATGNDGYAISPDDLKLPEPFGAKSEYCHVWF